MRYNANNIKYNQASVKYNGIFTVLLEDYSNLTTISTITVDSLPSSLVTFNILNDPVFATISASSENNYQFAEANFGLITFTKADVSNEIQDGQPIIGEIKTINISTMGSL